MRLTVGPLPPAVYWRRRAIVLGAVLLALFLVAQACLSAAASPEDRADAGPTPTGSATPGPDATTPSGAPSGSAAGEDAAASDQESGNPADTTPADGPTGEPPDPPDADTCTDDEMLITAEADATSFESGTSVQFTIRIQNDSDRTCRRDVGGDQRELYLRRDTGSGKFWSLRDCSAPSGRSVQELGPEFDASHWIVWNGRASDSCDGDDPAGELAAPGEYQLVARLGTARSEPLPITVR